MASRGRLFFARDHDRHIDQVEAGAHVLIGVDDTVVLDVYDSGDTPGPLFERFRALPMTKPILGYEAIAYSDLDSPIDLVFFTSLFCPISTS